jgi:hypothetical protein
MAAIIPTYIPTAPKRKAAAPYLYIMSFIMAAFAIPFPAATSYFFSSF